MENWQTVIEKDVVTGEYSEILDTWQTIMENSAVTFPEMSYREKYPANASKWTVEIPQLTITNCQDLAEGCHQKFQYKIDKEIARGGMGVILRGHQQSLKRDVAIKKILEEIASPNALEKFVAEARVTAYLDHPNIVPIHELGQDEDGNPIINMKLIQGESWEQMIGNRSYLNDSEGLQKHLDILMSVCNAMAFAHTKGIIHNDLKPDNIMVGHFGEVFVMDWGLAVNAGAPEDLSVAKKEDISSPMGTPSYMPPELAKGEGENIGPWTDVYLLGGILYKILVGHSPHNSDNIWNTLYQAIDGIYAPLPAKTPEKLKEICQKALAKNFQDRYPCVHKFKEALQEFSIHRESIKIAEEAREKLNAGLQLTKMAKEKNYTPQQLRDEVGNPYCPFSQAVFGFCESLSLWQDNKLAIQGKNDAYIGYSNLALFNGDWSLAENLLDDIAQCPEKDNIINEVKTLKKQNFTGKMRKYTWIIWGAVFIAGIVLGKLL